VAVLLWDGKVLARMAMTQTLNDPPGSPYHNPEAHKVPLQNRHPQCPPTNKPVKPCPSSQKHHVSERIEWNKTFSNLAVEQFNQLAEHTLSF
jgi:hypothetical protein